MSDINKRLEVLEETMAKMQEVIDNIRREAKTDPGEITVGDVVRNIRTKERFVVTIVDEGKLVTGINKVGAPRDYYLLSEVEKNGRTHLLGRGSVGTHEGGRGRMKELKYTTGATACSKSTTTPTI